MNYDINSVKEKVEYCLNCKVKPCSNKGCPLNNDIPAFISLIKNENYEEAYNILTNTTVLPSICGRICPHESQCMGSCVRGIKGDPVCIGELEAFIGDMAIENDYKIKKYEVQDLIGWKIAVIGGGPAGLTASAFLARRGAEVTILEKHDYLGGLLVHGIPEFRLDKDIVKKSIDKIVELGIKVKYNEVLGKTFTIKDIEKDYDKIILAFGGNISYKMEIEGEDLQGVYGGNELLELKDYSMFKGKMVIVNGGGDVAMDVARTAKRNGAKSVKIVYRRSKEEMPASNKEINATERDGVEFLFQTNIIKILGKEKVAGVELIKTELIKKENESRLKPVNIEGSNFGINADIIAMALGSHPEEFINDLGVELNEKGCIKVDEYGKTSNEKIYAIGNLAGNKKTVAWASRSGRIVAEKL